MRVASLSMILLVVLSAVPCEAGPVRLKTGETIRGRALPDHSDERTLAILDYATGNLRRIRWEVLTGDQRDSYARAWGWLDRHTAPVDGVRLSWRMDDGSSRELTGLLEEGADLETLRLRSDGVLHDVPRERVLDEERVFLDPRSIWTAEQLHARCLETLEREGADLANLSPREALRVARAAYWALHLEEALSFAALARDTTDRPRDLAIRAEALLGQPEALEQLKAALAHLRHGRLVEARAARKALWSSRAVAEPTMREQLADLDAGWREALGRMVWARVPALANRLIEQKARDSEATLAASLRWAEDDLEQELFVALAAALEPSVGPVSPIELHLSWLNRSPDRLRRRASYGAGTLVVVPPVVPIPRAGAEEAQPDVQAWWARSSSRERVGFLLAVFAEHSDVFQVGAGEGRSCMSCNGAGTVTRLLQSGESVQSLCPRCGGAQEDRVIRFR